MQSKDSGEEEEKKEEEKARAEKRDHGRKCIIINRLTRGGCGKGREATLTRCQ